MSKYNMCGEISCLTVPLLDTFGEEYLDCNLRADYPNEAFRCRFGGKPDGVEQFTGNLPSNPPTSVWYVEADSTFFDTLLADPNYEIIWAEEIVDGE